jgi:hypothetical protein
MEMSKQKFVEFCIMKSVATRPETLVKLISNNGKFENSLIEEFDFAYKKSDDLLETQPYLIKIDQTIPIATVKFIAV